jgi:hypothetical protein
VRLHEAIAWNRPMDVPGRIDLRYAHRPGSDLAPPPPRP